MVVGRRDWMVVEWKDWSAAPEDVVAAQPRRPELGHHVVQASTVADGRVLLAHWDPGKDAWSHYALLERPL